MALRSDPALAVATTGPRSRAVLAFQRMGKRLGVPAPGCEVSRMWDVLLADMAVAFAASRIEKALSPARRRLRAFERGLDARDDSMTSLATSLPGPPLLLPETVSRARYALR